MSVEADGLADRTPRLRRNLRYLGWCVLLFALLGLVARVFCVRIFHVETASMEPTIHGAAPAAEGVAAFPGHRVLVGFGPLFSPESLERFDLVVIDRGEGGPPFVKRVVGFPGERLQLSGGDLLVDGERLPSDAPRPPSVEVFAWGKDSFEECFHFALGDDSPWSFEDEGAFRLSGTDVPAGAERGMALLQRELADDVRLGNGAFARGRHQVNDGALSFEVSVSDPLASGHLRARLVEEGDIFEAELTLSPGKVRVSLLRSPGGEVLTSAELVTLPSRWTRVFFENRDNRLRLTMAPAEAPEELVLSLEVSYEANRAYEAVLPPGITSIAPRVAFGGDGLDARFRELRVTRDLFWTPTGPWGSRPSIELGPDEYFLLGDNSANSLDSRYWGPVHVRQLLGRPLAIVDPWQDRRWLPSKRSLTD